MGKQHIKLRFQNGLSFDSFKKEVFDIEQLNELYDLLEVSDDPDVIIFGPYGNDIPAHGPYVRVGYYCENFMPDMAICEWAFGVPHEKEVNDPRYKRIQWHGTDPAELVKPADHDADEILDGKTHFCNFLYSHKVPYREEFFRQLSKYKKVDAPGRSMNNMPGIDSLYEGSIWERKRQFLNKYKFTIAFENYVYPGYQTEKLYDAMQANSIPVYCGDPGIGEIFNTGSFVNAADHLNLHEKPTVRWLEKHSQPDFRDIRPSFYHSPADKIRRKLKTIGRDMKMTLQFRDFDFSPLIERIIELDQDHDKYKAVMQQPWFNNNKPPANASNRDRWAEIFNSIKN